MEEVEVKIISTEIVKPCTPTPCHLKTFSISLMDQSYETLMHCAMFLAFSTSNDKSQISQQHPNVPALKTALSQTLSQFYPLAGRCKDQSTFDCNDEGIPFIVAHVLSHPTRFLDVHIASQNPDLLTKFLPPQELRAQVGVRPVYELPLLAFQINVFPCGGIIIGLHSFHKLLDASSLTTFLNHWATLAAGKSKKDLIHPDYEASFKAFPLSPTEPPASSVPLFHGNDIHSSSESLVVRSFAFPRATINDLRARAASTTCPNPTSFEVVAGLIWKYTTLAARELVGPAMALVMAASIRTKINPPLPRGSMGNLFLPVQAQADKGASSTDLVAQIHATLSIQVVQKIDMLRKSEKPLAFMIRCRRSFFHDLDKAGFYGISSLCKIGIHEVDFGFGKPIWFMVEMKPSLFYRNFISLTDYIDYGGEFGVLARICLEEKNMQNLESNSDFLACTETLKNK